TAAGRLLASRNFRYFEMYLTLAIIYFLITTVVSWILRRAEKHLRCNERQAAGPAWPNPAAKIPGDYHAKS
ncbi:MAG: hypothetical protein LBG07_06015, partial [Treponema sp.]|nr:hypothetical protein [Treponema sp.]